MAKIAYARCYSYWKLVTTIEIESSYFCPEAFKVLIGELKMCFVRREPTDVQRIFEAVSVQPETTLAALQDVRS